MPLPAKLALIVFTITLIVTGLVFYGTRFEGDFTLAYKIYAALLCALCTTGFALILVYLFPIQ